MCIKRENAKDKSVFDHKSMRMHGGWGAAQRADDKPYGVGLLFWTQFDELILL